MWNRTVLITLLVLLTSAGPTALAAQTGPVADPELAGQLLSMAKEDQRVRTDRAKRPDDPMIIAAMADVDKLNQQSVRRIFEQRGWPGPSLVGQPAADAWWLLVQHFPALLRDTLPLMKAAAERGELSNARLAKSIDRVLTMDGKPQLYGTQFKLQSGVLEPFPMEDSAHVNERRAKMGLESYEENLAQIRAEWGIAPPVK